AMKDDDLVGIGGPAVEGGAKDRDRASACVSGEQQQREEGRRDAKVAIQHGCFPGNPSFSCPGPHTLHLGSRRTLYLRYSCTSVSPTSNSFFNGRPNPVNTLIVSMAARQPSVPDTAPSTGKVVPDQSGSSG